MSDVVAEARKVLIAHDFGYIGVDSPKLAIPSLLSLIGKLDNDLAVSHAVVCRKQDQIDELRRRSLELNGQVPAEAWFFKPSPAEKDAVRKATDALAELAQFTGGQRNELERANAQIKHLEACNANLIERLRHLEAGAGLA